MPTPKLQSVTRWLTRVADAEEADWDSVVWLDDVLGPDAREWARTHHQPVLLEKPDPARGLQESHVARVEAFTGGSPDAPLGPL